jgi:hypothetical protein
MTVIVKYDKIHEVDKGASTMSNESSIKLIDGNSFINDLEKRLILKIGEKEHENLKSKHEKELELVSAISMTRTSKKLSEK